jgi:hypothetical protein
MDDGNFARKHFGESQRSGPGEPVRFRHLPETMTAARHL